MKKKQNKKLLNHMHGLMLKIFCVHYFMLYHLHTNSYDTHVTVILRHFQLN